MKSSSVRWVVALGVVSVVGIVTIQVYWVRKAFGHAERQFNQTLYIALKNVATQLARYNQVTLSDHNLVRQLSSNYYVVNVNSSIDAGVLAYYLRSEFSRRNLRVDYEYAIYDCATDRMVYGDYVDFPEGGAGSSAPRSASVRSSANLPKSGQYTYYFGLRLPTRAVYLVSGLEIWILTSAILLVVILFFGYAMFVILRQKQLSEIQRDFINNMTHEFKTPLATIALSADVIARPAAWRNPQRLAHYAAIIREENSRLNKQVEKVLQIARTEKDFRPRYEGVDLHGLIEEVVRNFDLSGKHREGTVRTDLRATQTWTRADPLHLANVLFNLLDNAVKYTEGIPQVVFSTRNEHNRLLVSISDNGVGIDRVHQKRVFDKFYRVPTGDVYNVKGFGLGLYYVRNTAAAHRWKLSLESKPGRGSTFTLSLPVQPPEKNGKP
ncbi:MAG: HAMP domain-containing histidine kinase [Ferruginibacter sp.]|nr:HAMP domain-containing histidine kinase [Cytophagales bacterium]